MGFFLPDLELYFVSVKEENVLADRLAECAPRNSGLCSSNWAVSSSSRARLGESLAGELVHGQDEGPPSASGCCAAPASPGPAHRETHCGRTVLSSLIQGCTSGVGAPAGPPPQCTPGLILGGASV